MPPSRWALAKIIETHPGKDGLVRVATLKTQNGILTRPVSKLCRLPVDNNESTIEMKPPVLSEDQQQDNVSSQQRHQQLLYHETKQMEGYQTASNPQTCAEGEVQVKSLKVPQGNTTIDYDTLLCKAYKNNKPQRTTVKIAAPTTYSKLISKQDQEKSIEQLKNRYPKTVTQMEQRKRKVTCEKRQHNKEVKLNPVKDRSSLKTGPSTKSPTISNTSLMLILALLIMPILALNQEPIKFTPFKENPGLYFEDIGHINIVNSHWDIIAFYDISNYLTEIEGIRETTASLEKLCNLITVRKQFCIEILHQFQHQLRQIEEGHLLLNQLNGNLHARSRRAPLEIIGTVANKLFGILDVEYAEKINQEIEKTRTNENHLLSLLKNQTSLIESTMNVVKKQDLTIQNQFQIIKNHITSLKQLVEQTGNALKEDQTAHLIASLSTHTILIIYNCQRVQDMVLDVLTDLHHGKVNSLILTPSQLKRQITFIKEHLPRTLALPENKRNQLLLLYSLFNVKGRVLPSRIIFQIRVPLILNKEFQLYKLIPIPTLCNGGFFFIEPSSEYLAVGEHREYYFPLSHLEVDKCKPIDTDKYLCQQNHPMFNHESKTSQCEMELLNHKRNLSSSCKISKTLAPKLWTQLHAANHWLYSLDTEYTFSVICGSVVLSQSISGSGILKLRPDCLLKEPSMIIYGHKLYESRFNTSFLPKTNLSQFVINGSSQVGTYDLHIPNFNSSIDDVLIFLKAVDQLKQQETLPQQLTTHDVHQFSIIYMILAALLLGGTSYFIKKYCFQRCKQRKGIAKEASIKGPVPAKRKKFTEEDFCVVTTTP